MSGLCLVLILIIILFSCESSDQKEKRLAKKYCSSCHLFPDPELLSKTIWVKEVLPNMAFRMGLSDLMEGARYIPLNDLVTVASTLPAKPMVTEEEWQAIVNYYSENSPDSLISKSKTKPDSIRIFESIKLPEPEGSLPLITMIKLDTLTKNILLGTRSGKLIRLNEKFEKEATIQLSSPPSHVEIDQNEYSVALMGIMDPNDRSVGELTRFNASGDVKKILVDSLKRPVYFEETDLNADGRKDFIVCAFGNYTGELAVYENRSNSDYRKHILSTLPGSRRTLAKDFNNDGLTDILALFTQGDEQLTLFINEGNFKFKRKNLLRFPPSYGSTYFDIVDFNNDGRFDVLYTNGDNSDYSQILKPYHGVRIYLQDDTGNFKESWFYPMHGASKAVALDFDLDGDLDIASFSFFPDYYNNPEQGFIYFENTEGQLLAQTLSEGSAGRWIVMDVADMEGDGDFDIILGALDFNTRVPKELYKTWEQEKTAVLILKNRTR